MYGEFERFQILWKQYGFIELPEWYTFGLHSQVLDFIENGERLKAVKAIHDIGKEYYKKLEINCYSKDIPFSYHPFGTFGLKEAKTEIFDNLEYLIKNEKYDRDAYLKELESIIPPINNDIMKLKQLKAITAASTLPTWYGISIHNEIVKMISEGNKLEACKLLMDTSRQFDTKEVFNLRWAKEDIVDKISKFLSTIPEEELVNRVADLINDEIQNNYDMSGLKHLLEFVPKQELLKYLGENVETEEK